MVVQFAVFEFLGFKQGEYVGEFEWLLLSGWSRVVLDGFGILVEFSDEVLHILHVLLGLIHNPRGSVLHQFIQPILVVFVLLTQVLHLSLKLYLGDPDGLHLLTSHSPEFLVM